MAYMLILIQEAACLFALQLKILMVKMFQGNHMDNVFLHVEMVCFPIQLHKHVYQHAQYHLHYMLIHQMATVYVRRTAHQLLILTQMIYKENVFHHAQLIILHNLIQENVFLIARKHMAYLQILLIKLALLLVIKQLILSLILLQCNVLLIVL